MKVLVVDIGGTHIKAKTPHRPEPYKIDSGPHMTPDVMMKAILAATSTWKYDRVSLGYPGVVVHDKAVHEPANLGEGWVGFDFQKAFKKPSRMLNDAAMQALGSYEGGRMLFFGLGTGLGSAMVVEGVVQPMELAHLPYKGKKTYEDFLGAAGLKKKGKKKWREHVLEICTAMRTAMAAEYVVLGGGNAKLMHDLPDFIRLGSNENAFKGGQEMWHAPQARKSSARS